MQSLFAGKDETGKRYGVSIRKDENGWYYEISGNLWPLDFENGRIGQFPFSFSCDDERKAFEDTRNKLSSRNYAIQTNGIAKAKNRFVQVRGSRDSGVGDPRVQIIST